MRIVFFADVDNNRTGGMSKQIHCVSDALTQLGHSIESYWSNDFPRPFRIRQHRVFDFPIRVAMFLQARSESYDVACIHEPSGYFSSLIGSCMSRFPAVVPYVFASEHRGWIEQFGRIASPSLNSPFLMIARNRFMPLTTVAQSDGFLRRSDHIICVSTYDRDFFISNIGIRADKISRIDIGVSDDFRSVDQSRVEDSNNSYKLLFVGSWISRKGVNTLSRAFSQLVQEIPELRITLMGTGIETDYVLQYFPLESRHAVRVVPQFSEEELREALGEHAIFVLPSFNEGMPLSLLEAMAAGLAVVSTVAGAIPDVIRSEHSGILVRPGDVGQLAGAIRRCVTDGGLRSRLGQSAKATVNGYTWERSAVQHLAAFQAACDAKERRIQKRGNGFR